MSAQAKREPSPPVLVAGGGPVGATLALALRAAGVHALLVDPGDAPGKTGERPIALSASSIRILDTLGVWPRIAPLSCPIRTVHVSEKGRFGMVRLRAGEHGVQALGAVVPASAIGDALDAALDSAGVPRIAARVAGVAQGDGAVHVSCDPPDAGPVRAALLVVAEGGGSALLGTLGIACRQRDYRQAAVVCTVTPGRAHADVAYERFTADGPLALLPLRDGRCALVWTLPDDRAHAVAALSDAAFLEALQAAFGHRLGRLRAAGARTAFPLALVRSESLVAPRVALVGNAANRLHPVAGQGLNLGLRDAATLADLVAAALRAGGDPGDPALLADYARRRRPDQRAVARFTDTLARGFTVSAGPAGTLRSLSMLALDLLPPLGSALARRAMGLAGRQPRLVRGVLP